MSKPKVVIMTIPRMGLSQEAIKQAKSDFATAGFRLIVIPYANNSPSRPNFEWPR